MHKQAKFEDFVFILGNYLDFTPNRPKAPFWICRCPQIKLIPSPLSLVASVSLWRGVGLEAGVCGTICESAGRHLLRVSHRSMAGVSDTARLPVAAAGHRSAPVAAAGRPFGARRGCPGRRSLRRG